MILLILFQVTQSHQFASLTVIDPEAALDDRQQREVRISNSSSPSCKATANCG
jgi:hypothetical protein